MRSDSSSCRIKLKEERNLIFCESSSSNPPFVNLKEEVWLYRHGRWVVMGELWVFDGHRLNEADFFCQHLLLEAFWLVKLLSLTHSPDNEAWHNFYWFTNTVIKRTHVSCLFPSSLFSLLSSLHFLSFCSTHWMLFSSPSDLLTLLHQYKPHDNVTF